MHNITHMIIWYTAVGLHKTIKRKIIQRFLSKVLCLITNAPWHVSNFTLHNDLQIPFVMEEIQRCQHSTIKAYSDTITDQLQKSATHKI
jgi:hypothetical protein